MKVQHNKRKYEGFEYSNNYDSAHSIYDRAGVRAAVGNCIKIIISRGSLRCVR